MPNKARSVSQTSDNHRPLAGASVVVTRPSASAAATKANIRALGGIALALPGITLRGALDPASVKAELAAARDSDVVIFVSPAAVKYAFAIQPKLRFIRTAVIAAMGAATARALQRKGFKQVIWPLASQTSEGLLAAPEMQKLRGKRVTLIGAPGGRDLLAQTLKQRKARVQHILVYRRLPPRFSKAQLAALEAAQTPLITLLTSQEILDNLRSELPLSLFGKLAEGDLVVSSLRLALAARASLFGAVHIAASPSPRDLVRAACGALAQHRL
ncbi:MAG: uroporphyrinogen-III synthase [Rudaea sp.]